MTSIYAKKTSENTGGEEHLTYSGLHLEKLLQENYKAKGKEKESSEEASGNKFMFLEFILGW